MIIIKESGPNIDWNRIFKEKMKKQKRRDVQEARKMHLEAKKMIQQEMEKKAQAQIKEKEQKEMTPTPQDKIKQIYEKARREQEERKRKEETLKADEEPTVLHPSLDLDLPTEEIQEEEIQEEEIQEEEIQEQKSLQEQIQELTKISHLTNKEKKDILNLALKVKELNDRYDLLHNNIINLYHLTRK